MQLRRIDARAGGQYQRRGAAVVEMAAVAPVLILLLMGILEFGWLFYVKQCMLSASQVGARAAIMPGATDQQIQSAVDATMTQLGFDYEQYQYETEITHPTGETQPNEIVKVSLHYAQVTILGGFFGFLGIDEIGSMTAMRPQIQPE